MLCAVVLAALAPDSAFAAPECKNEPAINPAQTNDAVAGARVDLTTQGVDNDASFEWRQTGGERGDLELKNNRKNAVFTVPLVTDPLKAAITIQVTVTACGYTRTATAVINARANVANQAPRAVAKVSPGAVAEYGTFSLDGRDSTDPEQGALAYRWEQVDHLDDFPIAGVPANTALVENLLAPADVPYPAGVAIKFQLTVTDPGGLTGIDKQSLTISWVNDPPVARAKVIVFDAAGNAHASTCPFPEDAPVEVNEGADFILDGSASTDDDGIAPYGTYLWSQAAGGPSIPGGLPSASTTPDVSLAAPGLTPLLGDTMELQLEVTDNLGLAGALSPRCVVKVNDITPPRLTVPGDLTAEASGPGGAAVTFTATAEDNFDGILTPTCNPSSGSTFPLDASTLVTCSAIDAHGNGASAGFTVTVTDTRAPEVKVPGDLQAEATGSAGAVVTFAAPTADDLVDGPVTPSCSARSGDLFPLGLTTVTCSATDAHGNAAAASFTISVVDTTPPALTVPADVTTLPTLITGEAVVEFTAHASDTVDPAVVVVCSPPSGSRFPPNRTTEVTCTATDFSGNQTKGAFHVTVQPFAFNGFFAPVDMRNVLNTVKGGSTVPVKWTMADRNGPVTDTRVVTDVKASYFDCDALSGSLESAVEYTATGGTALRYDGRQFILNWQTKKTTSTNTCYQLFVVFTDGTNQSALFKLK
jgi:hypothetical protein